MRRSADWHRSQHRALCHFDCFDDNQRIAGVIPFQLGINFPVDLLGFRRQLFSLFGAGDEQITIGNDAVQSGVSPFPQVGIRNPDTLTAVWVGAFPTLPNPVLTAHLRRIGAPHSAHRTRFRSRSIPARFSRRCSAGGLFSRQPLPHTAPPQ